jgi:hypothetical protein
MYTAPSIDNLFQLAATYLVIAVRNSRAPCHDGSYPHRYGQRTLDRTSRHRGPDLHEMALCHNNSKKSYRKTSTGATATMPAMPRQCRLICRSSTKVADGCQTTGGWPRSLAHAMTQSTIAPTKPLGVQQCLEGKAMAASDPDAYWDRQAELYAGTEEPAMVALSGRLLIVAQRAHGTTTGKLRESTNRAQWTPLPCPRLNDRA